MKRLVKITFDFDDGSKAIISDRPALLFQSRINTAGILSGIDVEEFDAVNKEKDEKVTD